LDSDTTISGDLESLSETTSLALIALLLAQLDLAVSITLLIILLTSSVLVEVVVSRELTILTTFTKVGE